MNSQATFLQKYQQTHQLESALPRILEINPHHPVIQALTLRATQDGALDALRDPALLLFDQALIVEGEAPSDPVGFARRLSDLMAKGVAGG